ncbi:MAG: preprotein translocase subunit SecA [Clostridiales bacterium]|nr:preprotein translocase subunit SecA [Clostridiales bacterium]
MSLITKIFGTYSDHQIKKILPTVDKIEALAPKYKEMSDADMRATTDRLRETLQRGHTLNEILPDAYALVREAADRVLGKRPFRVQLMCGILLHQGRVAEMKTGEGKTLVAALPAYLNALTGKGVHIVTVNEYLAKMGQEEIGRIHEFLGLTTGLIVHDQTKEQKKAAYNCDITYGTNNEFGFDYLRDNMATYKENQTQRGHAFAIVDEVDSILIDEARTPLIISGHGTKTDELYQRAEALARTMTKFVIKELDTKVENDQVEQDYIVDEKARSCTLTANGIKKAEAFFGIENLSDPENADISHHIYQAIRAHGIMKRDTDYVVNNNEVMIVDTFTGRIMPGRRYSDGLHQAIEAKEGVEIQRENRTIATITFQNYFRMYDKLSGMTGTALSEENEFREIYNLDVVEVPTNKPMIRIDHSDVVYTTVAGKDRAVIRQIVECHEKGQPVLVGTVSVEKSEKLSKKLKAAGIPHNVLNAKYHEKEAEIVAQAGKLGAVTISTNMAGRGTDILLGGNAEYLAKQQMRKEGYEEEIVMLATGSSQSVSEEVFEARKHYRELYDKYKEEIKPEAEKVIAAGGLFVIGTERHDARRIDNQLRGRSGRQGDPGESRFYLSLEDDLMRLFGSERILGIVSRLGITEDDPIDARILSNSIESAQKRLEDQNFERRKNVLAYDDVMNQQRKVIYQQRQEVLEGGSLREKMLAMIRSTISDSISQFLHEDDISLWDIASLKNKYLGLLCQESDFNNLSGNPEELRESIRTQLLDKAMEIYEEKEQKVFGEEVFREVERVVLLRNVDSKWMDHLEAMDSLMDSIGLQAYAQRNPISEYRIAGADLFDEMITMIRDDTVRMLLSVMPRPQTMKREQIIQPVSAGFAGAGDGTLKKKPVVKKAAEKVGRNDPCPCGSGKKYKKCCGAGTKPNENT